MVSYDLLLAVVFYAFLIIFFLRNRNKFEIQGKIIGIYRTKLGLKLMDKIASKFKTLFYYTSYISIFTGFVGMIIILFFLTKSSIELLFIANAQPAISPILPGLKIPGLPNLSFWHWIITIFIVAVVHEFAHGIFARLYKIKVKSSGLAFFGPILAAFVEPEEYSLRKSSKKAQLSIISAGPFSNFIFTIIFILILAFVIAPINNKIFSSDGIIVNKIVEEYPISQTQITTPFTITSINNKPTNNMKEFIDAFKDIKPSDVVELETDQGPYQVTAAENPDNPDLGFIGISHFEPRLKNVLSSYKFLGNLMSWLTLLVFWLQVINLGVGLFNLFPLGPIDGGRFFQVFALWLFKDNQAKANKATNIMSMYCLLLLFINLAPYLIKFLIFLAKPILLLIAFI